MSAQRRARLSDRHAVGFETVQEAVLAIERKLSEKIGAPTCLTRDQYEALLHVTTEKGDIKLVQGYAGTGKTEMLAAARIAWEKSGYKVLGTSITAKAAQKSGKMQLASAQHHGRRVAYVALIQANTARPSIT